MCDTGGRGPCAEPCFWGHRGRELCPGAPLRTSSSRGPVEKHSFSNEMCSVGLHMAATCMVPWCEPLVALTEMQCSCLNSVQCPARVVLGLSQLLSM